MRRAREKFSKQVTRQAMSHKSSQPFSSYSETPVVLQSMFHFGDYADLSLQASQMLRSSQEQQAKRDSFKGSGMLTNSDKPKQPKQTQLFGQVRKANVERDERPAKRARTGEAVGLGIAGVGR